MMLYVFHVDVGRMMSFDMTVALSSVENLKDTIERLHGIPAANIVLLVSGGEMLTESTQVSYYSAGTDTNPIYMFLTGDVKVLPPTMPQTDTDHDLRGQVERSMELPAVYDTVVTRTQLAVKMYEHAREEERLCERLVQDQHLQQQGWAAVVANMEDLTEEFRLRFRNFCSFFDRHLAQRTRHLELLQNFNADLSKLSRIPILPGLMPLAEADFHGFDEYLDNDDVFSRSHNQQESVLVARPGATGPEAAAAGSSTTSAISDACDTSSTSTTSPNKKAKMGENDPGQAGQGSKTEQSSSVVSGKNVRRITLNLLQWITSKENHNALQTMSIECVQGLSTFNEEIYEKLKSEVQNTINIAEQGDVKEIRGLGERLCKLDEFKYKIKNMVQEQKEHSTGFQQNQSRAINLRDPSILPDLCDSHRSQMHVMLQNHQKILEHRRCIAKAKDELGTNLHMRLNRIVCIENAMSDIDNRLLFYHRYLRRAERHINIIEQIHQAPCIYVGAVTEVVRRKIFSEEFGKWASKLSDDFDSIHSEEIKRREMFNASFEGHFLNILFPGMNDMPPAFANENPLTFDARLPNLTKSDIELLSSYLPDLANQIRLPDMWPVIKFFVSRSGDHQKERWQQLLKQQEANELADTPQKPQHIRLTDLQKGATIEMSERSGGGGGCDESETDTEIEFEKVPAACVSGTTSLTSQAPEESEETEGTEKTIEVATLTRSTLTECLLMTSAETLTDENGTAIRDEVERLRQLLSTLSQHSLDCIRMARCNLKTFRTDAEAYSNDLRADIQSLHDTCKLVRMRCEEREQELLQQNHVKDEELEKLRAQLKSRDVEIERLQAEVNSLRDKYDLLAEEMKEEIQATFNREKETAVAMAREELIHEHKTEIESLRCRFKLMTSIERSPSDMSLEKIERPSSRVAAAADEIIQPADQSDMIELKQHEAAIRAQLQAEKERAVNAAVEAERIMWQSKITLNSESVMANVGILKVIEEKERQLEQLRERELMLTKENFQLKTRLDALTNEDANSWLKEKIEYLHRDKERLEKELEKSRRVEMEGSYAGPPRSLAYEHNIVPRSKSSSSSSHKYIVLQTLEKGDVVFTVWSTIYGQYIVVQDSQNLFFVHGESLAGLQLQLPKREIESPVAFTDESTASSSPTPTIPIPFYAVGIVVEKEYCQARKDENRYRVPRGSKFYRVKIAPLAIAQPTVRVPRDRLESCSKSVIRSQYQCESQSEAPSGALMAAVSSSVMQLPTPGPISEGTTAITTTTRRIRSTGSKSEEEEPLQLSERCRYVSVNEEEESSVTNTGNQQQQQQQPQPQQSVITEQPTASNQLKLDLMLLTTTTAITTTTTTTTTTTIQRDPIMAKGAEDSPKEHKEIQSEDHLDAPNTSSSSSDACLASASAAVVAASTEIPISSFGTTSEDSDEYRSLEGKEEDTAFSALDD